MISGVVVFPVGLSVAIGGVGLEAGGEIGVSVHHQHHVYALQHLVKRRMVSGSLSSCLPITPGLLSCAVLVDDLRVPMGAERAARASVFIRTAIYTIINPL